MAAEHARSGVVKCSGHAGFQQRIVLSLLSGRTVRIDHVREDAEEPGLQDFEVSLLRLVEAMTNGTQVAINETGTSVRFRPGTIEGGSITHECAAGRAIGYYALVLLQLAPFARRPLAATLRGVTDNDVDVGADIIRTVTLPLLARFGLREGLELKIVKRGVAPLGGGEVVLTCPIVRSLGAVNIVDAGTVRRVRGVAYATRVAPSVANRMVDTARGVFNSFLPDVWVYTDHYKGDRSGLSPGFGISLLAESTHGTTVAAEGTGAADTLPEDLGRQTAVALLREIERMGVVDHAHEPIALLFMALGPEDVSRIRIGELQANTVFFLRLLHDFFRVRMQLKHDPTTNTVVAAVRGVGFVNVAKRAI